jgi:hypothetical protein
MGWLESRSLKSTQATKPPNIAVAFLYKRFWEIRPLINKLQAKLAYSDDAPNMQGSMTSI